MHNILILDSHIYYLYIHLLTLLFIDLDPTLRHWLALLSLMCHVQFIFLVADIDKIVLCLKDILFELYVHIGWTDCKANRI